MVADMLFPRRQSEIVMPGSVSLVHFHELYPCEYKLGTAWEINECTEVVEES
jgi:hypothetical protein